MDMFCYQCSETSKGTGCTVRGVCGKDPETSALQELLIHACKGISQYAHRARKLGASVNNLDVFVVESLFTTVTNVNFDPDVLIARINAAINYRDVAKKLYLDACIKNGENSEKITGPVTWQPAENKDELLLQGGQISVLSRIKQHSADVAGLQELILYGVKGMAAYADHALILGVEDDNVYAYFHEVLNFLASDVADLDSLVAMTLKVGEVNLRVMEMLDEANTGTYGHPVPTQVRTSAVAGKAILVSGHDLKDLEELLKQTEGKGVNIYTHSEMLPAHGYPGLKKFSHLVGNYGGAWQDQRKEFEAFPGAILMTTNCIQKPKDNYKARIFTTGLVEWPGVTHIKGQDYSEVINAALEVDGFQADEEVKEITVGFGHNSVLGVADKIVDAVKTGQINHFFLIGGCDGRSNERNYYTDFAKAVPDDAVMMTLACGKYRINSEDYGDIGGIPRLLDIGQCNDAYSAIKIAAALADAFDCGLNDLPLSLILSWYEQKAVCILLSLLHLGMKDIRLGPKLPAFISPAVLQVLVDNFNIMPITSVEEDLNAILGTEAVA